MNKKAVATTLGATIFFAMVFTTGIGFLTFVNTTDFLQDKATTERSRLDLDRQRESFIITGVKVGNNVGLIINNTGPVTVNVSAIFVSNSTKLLKRINASGGGSITLPFVVNSGQVSSTIDTGVVVTSTIPGAYTIKVVTFRGSVLSGTYPPVGPPGIVDLAQGVTTAVIGKLLINFTTLETCIPATQDCNASSTAWTKGWKVVKNDEILFRMKIKNTGSKRIFLAQEAVFTGLGPMSISSSVNSYNFFIKKPPTAVDDDGLPYSPDFGIALETDAYTTLYFGANAIGGDILGKFPTAGIFTLVLVVFAFEDANNDGIYQSGTDTTPYAQSLPFQAVLVLP